MQNHRNKAWQATCLASLAMAANLQADNLWLNTSGNYIWDLSSHNWQSPAVWSDADYAIFGSSGVGTIYLGAPVTVGNLVFQAGSSGDVISGLGNSLTFFNSTNQPTIIQNGSSTIAASIQGPSGLAFTGAGTTTILGDTNALIANSYSGGTFITNGTVILRALSSSPSGNNYGIDSLEQLDAGATLRIGVIDNGPNLVTDMPKGQIGLLSTSRLHLTGGTLDLNGWSRNGGNTQIPCPDGYGLIVNNSSNVQSALVVVGDGQNHEFSGSINDGGPLNITGTGSYNDKGYQIGIIDLHYGSGNYELTLSGHNTYSGSTRLGNGSVKLSGAGTLGVPSSVAGVTGPLRVYGPNHLDLNGTSQTIGAMGAGDANGKIYNTAVGTLSTLTFGFGPNNGSCPSMFMDNDGVNPGGVLALTKIGTGNQTLSGANTYSGDTTVSSGTLTISAAGAVSPNSSYKLSSTGGALALTYSGDAPVRSLSVDGVRLPFGTYGAGTGPITGTGTLTPSLSSLYVDAAGGSWNTSTKIWKLTSAGVASTNWIPACDAIMQGNGTTGLNLTEPVDVHSMIINGNGWNINGNGNLLTLVDAGAGVVANGSGNNLNATLTGASGLTIGGTGTVSLVGDAALGGNTFTGGTYVRGGTLILANPYAVTSGQSYAVDSIEAIDAGATVREGNSNDGLDTASSNVKIANGQLPVSGSAFLHHLNLTGGTYDTYGNDNNQQQPQPSGTGTIINTSPNARGILKFTAYGTTTEFAGQIADGGVTIARTNAGPGYQMNVDCQAGSGGTLILSGSNYFTGFLRIGNNETVKLKGAGTLGYTAPINCPTRQIIQNNGTVDLNGTSQKTGVYYSAAGGVVTNSAVGTISMLTVCNNATNTTVPSQGGILCNLQDTPGSSGILGLTMAGATATAIQAIAGANNTYSGDTVVSSGILRFDKAGSISPNSIFRLSTTRGTLALNYSGTATVKRLIIDGVEKANGTYGVGTSGISGTGSIQVVGAVLPPTLGVAKSGSGASTSLTFSWTGGGYKLQSKTNSLLGAWFDYPGGATSPVVVPVNGSNKQVYFRLSN